MHKVLPFGNVWKCEKAIAVLYWTFVTESGVLTDKLGFYPAVAAASGAANVSIGANVF
jgi:hypothetical protein